MNDEIKARLDRIESRTAVGWLDINQAAEYLSCSVSLLRKLIAADRIPFRRLPGVDGTERGAIRFNRKELDLWLLSGGDIQPTKRIRQRFEGLL